MRDSVQAAGALLLAAAGLLSCSNTACTSALHVGSWNVYFKALDDPAGQQAILDTIDGAGAQAAFDLFAVVEAQGDSAIGALEQWSVRSKALGQLESVNGTSGYEKIALFYRGGEAGWSLRWHTVGEFEAGRPYLIAQLVRNSDKTSTFVVVVHLNHYFITYPNVIDPVVPGQVLAAALQNASLITGTNISTSSVVMMGDWNEFEWADFQQPYRADAQKRMKPLWEGYFGGRMRDAVPPRTVSCCTKWAAADRFSTQHAEWLFEYDHIFFSDDLAAAKPIMPFLPYAYPGVHASCADPACTGEAPPDNVTATHQGSWHRAVHADLSLKSGGAPVAV